MEKMKLYLADIRTIENCEERGMELLGEQRRAKTLAMPNRQERLHSIGAGLLLRRVLNVSDEELCKGKFGKPELKSGDAHFNLSHGGNYAVLAVFGGSVGVDIEPVREDIPCVPEFIFTEKELEWLNTKPSSTRFAVLWTRLESVLKAHGGGFEGCHREFSVFDEDSPWYINTLMHDGHVISCATNRAFEPTVEFVPAEELLSLSKNRSASL